MIEKRRHFTPAEIARMALAVKEDEAFDPVNVGFLRAQAVMLAPDRVTNLIKEPGRTSCAPFRISIYHGGSRNPEIFLCDTSVTH